MSTGDSHGACPVDVVSRKIQMNVDATSFLPGRTWQLLGDMREMSHMLERLFFLDRALLFPKLDIDPNASASLCAQMRRRNIEWE